MKINIAFLLSGALLTLATLASANATALPSHHAPIGEVLVEGAKGSTPDLARLTVERNCSYCTDNVFRSAKDFARGLGYLPSTSVVEPPIHLGVFPYPVFSNTGIGTQAAELRHKSPLSSIAAFSLNCADGPDIDGDGVGSICDLDDDNDGILDLDESPLIHSQLSGGVWYGINGANVNNIFVGNVFVLPNVYTHEGSAYDLRLKLTSTYSADGSFGATVVINNVDKTINMMNSTPDDVETITYTIGVVRHNSVTAWNPEGQPALMQRIDLRMREIENDGWTNRWTTFGGFNGSGGFLYHVGSALSQGSAPLSGLPVYGMFPMVADDASAGDVAHHVAGFWETVHEVEMIFGVYGTTSTRIPRLSNSLGMNLAPYRDTDRDGVPDPLDLDSDNDGIFDVVESGSFRPQSGGMLNGSLAGHGIRSSVSNGSDGINYTIADTDTDGIRNYIDPDSDNDGCFDVIESGGTDANGNGILDGNNINADGQVTTGGAITDGYNGATGNEAVATSVSFSGSPTISNQEVTLGNAVTFSLPVSVNATNTTSFYGSAPGTVPNYWGGSATGSSGGINYQWYEGNPDAGGVLLGGRTSSALTFTPSMSDNGNVYYLVITHDDNVCIREINSASLSVVSDPCDPVLSGMPDIDGDGLTAYCDLDDDNDGIPDLDEMSCPTGLITLVETFNDNSSNPGAQSGLYPYQGVSVDFTYELDGTATWADGVRDDTDGGISGSYVEVQPTNTNVATGDVAIYTFDFSSPVHNLTFKIGGFDNQDRADLVAELDGVNVPIKIVDINLGDGYINGQTVADISGSIGNAPSNSVQVNIPSEIDKLIIRSGKDDGEVNTVTLQLYDWTYCLSQDADSDGVANHLDLDSDNDGIHDLDEAGHTAVDNNNDGVIDGPDWRFGTNGLFNALETVADNGILNYSISNSDSHIDGIYDAYEIDSDNDGCYDTIEEGVSDGDFNGIGGFGAPSVNLSNGLIIGHTYATPFINYWQNGAANGCPTISGRIFEDINYGGSLGRAYNVANASAMASGWGNEAIGIENVRVELYSAAGNFISARYTNGVGTYLFPPMLPANYQVRFATQTVTSNRESNSTWQPIYAVPTYRSVGATAYPAEIGGIDPVRQDAGINTTNLNISALNTPSTVAQAVSPVVLTSGSVSSVDLGLSFNVITNTNDAGIGSLRQFIINSNELANTNIDLEDNPFGRPVLAKAAGEDVSIFEIPGAGVHTIALASGLPDVRDANTHISGYTQRASVQGVPQSRTLRIGLDGTAGAFDGIRIGDDNITISGLALYDLRAGVTTVTASATGGHVWGNYIGLEVDGVNAGPNTSSGVFFNQQADGFIGTNGDGVNDLAEGNVIGNSQQGVLLFSSSNILIAGNYVGTDRTGQTPAGNSDQGIYIQFSPNKNVIGLDDNITTLTASAARNVSSGNTGNGVQLYSSNNQVIAGNYLGVDRLGTTPIANTQNGVNLIGATSNNQIGTDSDGAADAEERNIISGNGSNGIQFGGGSGTGNWIAGNFIGVDVTGNTQILNVTNGINLAGDLVNTIIGTNADGVRDASEGNVISGNGANGITITTVESHLIAGNKIGVGVDGTTSIPNVASGIALYGVAANNIIGYAPSLANGNPAEVGNIIQENGGTGITLAGTGINNRLSRNSYGNNGALAIDLGNNGVSANDNGDVDGGVNQMLNYPVLSYSKVDATTLRLKGFAPAGATIELYIADAGPNPSPLPVGFSTSFGEGFSYLGEVVEGSGDDDDATTGTYTDDGSGSASTKTQRKFSFDIPLSSLNGAVNVGDKLTAIVIDASGNTSEFSGAMSARFVEICNDLIDNDGDGEIDCEDDDCANVGVVTTISN